MGYQNSKTSEVIAASSPEKHKEKPTEETPAKLKFIDRIVSNQSILTSRIQKFVNLRDVYDLDSTVLGTGISGAVRVAQHKETGLSYAIKTLITANISPKKAALLHNEVAIYLKLDHPNIVKLFEVYEDESAVHLVMELCTGKELYDRLASKKRYCEQDAQRVARQMLSAVNYCHHHKICHRDLKLENWVYANESEDAPLKMIDFGFSRIFNPGVPMTAMHGTVYYVSPEVMDGCYDEKCDIWSIGVIMYMLLSGAPPFNGQHDPQILARIRKGKYDYAGVRWQGVSDEAKHFISAMLEVDLNKRATAEDALKHKWLDSDAPDTPLDLGVLKSMHKFAAANVMKRAALGLIAYSIHTKELDSLEQQFHMLDTNDKGTILLSELTQVLTTKLGLTPDEVAHVFKKVDQTGDSEIHYSEFLAATIQAKFILKENVIREAFQKFDIDKTGYISKENLRAVLGDEYNGTKIEDIVKQCDFKKNGVIDYEEFMAALTDDTGGSRVVLDSLAPSGSTGPEILRKVSRQLLSADGQSKTRTFILPKFDED
eukprot:Platyproteum_vivax@DN7068_c0_g1_i2.p1